MAVYLIHFDTKYKHAAHYVGFAEYGSVNYRFKKHCDGRGARLTQVVVGAGISLTLARVWDFEDRHFERKLKKRKNTPRYCPICKRKTTCKVKL